MEWLNVLLGVLAALFAGLNIFQVFSFRAYKKMHQAEAEKGEAEATLAKQNALKERLDAVEQLYSEQGRALDELRRQVLELKDEKFKSDQKVMKLESENSTLRFRVDELAAEVEAYKVIANANK